MRLARTGGPKSALPEAEIEALDQARNALGVHFEFVAGAQLAERLRLGLGDAAEVDQLVEEPLEARRGDDLQDPRRLVAGVPECVPLVARLEDQIARAADQDLVAEQAPTLPSST